MTTPRGSDGYPTTVPCRICNRPTHYIGTKLCDRCWELERRIIEDPDIARKILASLEEQK